MPGSVIKHYRVMRNYSQKYVAKEMGISQNAYSKIENNITQLTVLHLKKLSAILEIPELELLKDEFEIHKPLHEPGNPENLNDILALQVRVRKKLESKKSLNHTLYPAIFTLFRTIEDLSEEIK